MDAARLACVAGGVALAFAAARTAGATERARVALVVPPAPFDEPPVAAPLEPEPKRKTRAERIRERWLVSLEGALRAPSDLGVQVGVEFPIRLRFSAGFGFMPAEWITDLAASVTDDPEARRVLRLPDYSGTVWRTQLGYRPFPKLGLYLDGGYARASFGGSVDLSNPFLAELDDDLRGAYEVSSALDLWLFELGYQWQVANRGLLALGLGVMSTFHAETRVVARGGAPERSEFAEGAERVNDALETHGTVPFAAFRVGVDFL